MNRRSSNSVIACCVALASLLLAAPPLLGGEIIDRMVATVNTGVVLASDVEVALRFQALAQGTTVDKLPAGERERELQRLIDQRLLREQMERSSFAPADEKEVAAAVADFRAGIAGAGSDQGWHRALAAAGITEEEVRRRLAEQIEITRFVDQRFRPAIRVDRREVERYYNETLLPELRGKGQAVPPFAQVEAKIEDLLVEKAISEQLASWLSSLRAESTIRILPAAASLEAGGS